MKRLAAFVLAMTLTGCAITKPSVEQAAIADTATTAIALSRGAVETNPLGFVGATAVKVAVLAARPYMEPETVVQVEEWGTALWGGAAVNNVAVILGSPIALPLGIIAAIVLKIW